MVIRKVLTWLVSVFLAAPAAATPEEPSRFHTGVEWVLDADGNILASSAVALDRTLDLPHGTLSVHTIRQSQSASGLLAPPSRIDVKFVTIQRTPWVLEGRAPLDGDGSVELVEESHHGVLLSRSVVRDARGRIVSIHIVNATPLSESKFAALSAQM